MRWGTRWGRVQSRKQRRWWLQVGADGRLVRQRRLDAVPSHQLTLRIRALCHTAMAALPPVCILMASHPTAGDGT